MSLWKVAWRSIQQRSLASTLTAISMALGVALVVTVLVIYGVIDASFRRNAQGYNLIVGAKGSPLELVLNTVYHLGSRLNTIPYRVYEELDHGRFSSVVDAAIPVCIGDNYKNYRVVGTVPDMFEKLEYLGGKKYEFAAGRNFEKDHPMEAVVGNMVIRGTGLKVGDSFSPVHGLDAAHGSEHGGPKFTVVGILAPTGTPNDRALFVNMEGFYQIHAGKPDEDDDDEPAKGKQGAGKPAQPSHPPASADHPAEKRLSAVLVVLDETRIDQALALTRWINDEPYSQAVRPAEEIARLFETLIGHIELVLLILAVLIVIVAGIGILVSIYNSMNDRRHEIAIMRALGARRSTVMAIILLESILLSLGGGALGMLLGHSLVAAMTPLLIKYTGVAIGILHFQPVELWLIPGLVALASLVGYLPAIIAYRTDVARSLVAHP
jgi:putative ABC transport system permease protein